MECSNCHSEIPAQAGQCPNCGFLNVRQVPQPSLGRQKPVRLIVFCILCVVLIALVVQRLAIPAFREMQASRAAQETPKETPKVEVRSTRYAVEHGRVANPEELHGHGKLYFVPVGRQAIFVRSLAEYYAQKFSTQIYMLPLVKLAPSACVPGRNQCIAEEVVGAMANAYPDIARNPESVMIALTDEDIFPKDTGWDFMYSQHQDRMGVVSTRRMDPSFWGGRPDNAVRLASTKQMLTKYIALQYFHLPESFDPTSILFSPLTPNDGPDDIYESDLHSEASANGSRGRSLPCLFFSYSYITHEIKTDEPVLSNCENDNFVSTTDAENFDTNLAWGQVKQRSMDLRLNSTPVLEFKRGYSSIYYPPTSFALGWGTSHSYNQWLSSDGVASISYIHINHEDGDIDYLKRLTPGRGFDPSAVYESQSYPIYGAQLKWARDHYKLEYRDGAWSTFLPCDNPVFCYWTGYQDTQGNSLRFDRGPNRELRQLTASDNQGISFQLDEQRRTTKAEATDGRQVSYEYDSAGCLARVHRPDGQETVYEYDPAHHMTSMSVISSPGASQETILKNEYDSRGRVVTQTLKGVGSFHIEYPSNTQGYSSRVKVTTPAGDVLDISIGSNSYVARSQHVQFPAIPQQ
jgi:YD repeat-containing protein